MNKFSTVKQMITTRTIGSAALAVAVAVVTLGVIGQTNAAEAYVCGPFGCTPTCFINAFGFWVCG